MATDSTDIDARIACLNERYALADIGTYKSDRFVVEFDDDGDVVRIREFAAFKRHLCHEPPVRVDGSNIPLGSFWLTHEDARRFGTLVFAPPGSKAVVGPNDYNTWKGLAVQAAPGDWSLNEFHIREVVCSGNQEHERWMHNWIAALVQYPGQHAWVAPVLKGGQGIGKGYFANTMLGGLFRPKNYAHLKRPEDLTGDFNSHLENCVLVFADEAMWGDKKGANRLKGLITEDTIIINRKHVPQEMQQSALHIIIASNADVPLPVERDDRRLFILQVAEQYKQDQGYFGALHQELDEGGRAAMLHYFIGYKVDWELLRLPPETRAKREMKAESLSPEDEWWREVLSSADPETWQRTWANKIARGLVLERYSVWFDKFKTRGTKKSAGGLGSHFARHFKAGGMASWPRDAGKVQLVTDPTEGKKRDNAWRFPSLAECRAVFDNATGTSNDWPSDDAAAVQDGAA